MATKDPYASGMFQENPYYDKADIKAELKVVLQGRYEERGLQLMKPISRGVQKHEIHELIASDQADIGPGKPVDKIAYMGFMEITEGGVIIAGDELSADGRVIGHIAGFDETHMPNHLNIVVRVLERKTGPELGLKVGDALTLKQVKE